MTTTTVLHIEAPILTAPTIRHGFSFELKTDLDHSAFHNAVGLANLPIVRLKQVHAARVVDGDRDDAIATRLEGDAVVTSRADRALAIATADCVPLLLADSAAGVIGAVHAGWRGMCARVITRACEVMVDRGADPARLRVAIGPAIQGSCYAVGDEVRGAYDREFPEASLLFDGNRLDLIRAARAELRRAGIRDAHVSTLTDCTHCTPRLASHRRQGLDRGTNLAIVGRTDLPSR